MDSSGPAAVHVVRYRFPEVVVFGTEQELAIPATLNCGHHLRVMGKAGESNLTVTRYVKNSDPIRQQCSPRLVDVLKTVAAMGASYPDVVQLLLEAENQHNLAGELGVDRLPQAGRAFYRTKSEREGSGRKKAKLGSAALTPGLFDRVEESDIPDADMEKTPLERMFQEQDSMDKPDMIGGAFEDNHLSVDDESLHMKSNEPKSVEMNSDHMKSAEMAKHDLTEGATLDSSFDLNSDLSEPEVDGEDDFVLEQTEFTEPFAAKLKRIFRNPFKKESDQ